MELLLGASWSNTCQSEPGAAPRCSLPHLLGFCKLLTWHKMLNPTPGSAAAVAPVSYSYSFAYGPFAGWTCLSLLATSGAMADLVLWALLRLQYKLFRSQVYAEVRALCSPPDFTRAFVVGLLAAACWFGYGLIAERTLCT